MLTFKLLEQIDRRFGVNRLIKASQHLKAGNINGSVDIQPLTATIGFDFCLPALFDPAIRRNTVMLRMSRICKVDGVVWMLVFLEICILLDKGFLGVVVLT